MATCLANWVEAELARTGIERARLITADVRGEHMRMLRDGGAMTPAQQVSATLCSISADARKLH